MNVIFGVIDVIILIIVNFFTLFVLNLKKKKGTRGETYISSRDYNLFSR